MTDEPLDDPVLGTRIADHLTRLAVGTDVRRTPVEAIARRAAARRRRQRMAGAMGAVAVVVGATATALAAGRSHPTIAPEDSPPAVTVPAMTPPASTSPAPADSAPITTAPPATSPDVEVATTDVPSMHVQGAGYRWGRAPVDATSEFVLDESESIVFDSDGDVTWTVSTEPTVVATIWLTDDGTTWRSAPTAPTVEPVAVVRDGDRIDVAGWTVDPLLDAFRIATSDDGGATWSSRTVPLPDGARRLVTSDAASVDLARLDDTLVVTVPDLVGGDGLDDPQMFTAENGEPFVRVELPADVHPQGAFELEPVDGALLATAYDAEDLVRHLLRSTDGTSWTHLGVLPYSQGQVGGVGGRYVALSSDPATDGGDLWTSDDGTAWARARLVDLTDDALDWTPIPYGWVVDEAGVTLIATAVADAPPQLRLSENGVTMLFDAGLNDIDVIDDESGIVIGGYHDDASTGLARLGADSTFEVLDDSGAVRADFTLAEATAAIDAAPQQNGRAETAVFHTVDLVTWASVTVGALFDQPAPFVASAGSTGGHVVFRFPDGGGTSHQVIVGTPL